MSDDLKDSSTDTLDPQSTDVLMDTDNDDIIDEDDNVSKSDTLNITEYSDDIDDFEEDTEIIDDKSEFPESSPSKESEVAESVGDDILNDIGDDDLTDIDNSAENPESVENRLDLSEPPLSEESEVRDHASGSPSENTDSYSDRLEQKTDSDIQDNQANDSLWERIVHKESNEMRATGQRISQENYENYMNYTDEHGNKHIDVDPYAQNKADFYKRYDEAKYNYAADVKRYEESSNAASYAGKAAYNLSEKIMSGITGNSLDPVTSSSLEETAGEMGRMYYEYKNPRPIDRSADVRPEGLPPYNPDELASKLYKPDSMNRMMDANEERAKMTLGHNEDNIRKTNTRKSGTDY